MQAIGLHASWLDFRFRCFSASGGLEPYLRQHTHAFIIPLLYLVVQSALSLDRASKPVFQMFPDSLKSPEYEYLYPLAEAEWPHQKGVQPFEAEWELHPAPGLRVDGFSW